MIRVKVERNKTDEGKVTSHIMVDMYLKGDLSAVRDFVKKLDSNFTTFQRVKKKECHEYIDLSWCSFSTTGYWLVKLYKTIYSNEKNSVKKVHKFLYRLMSKIREVATIDVCIFNEYIVLGKDVAFSIYKELVEV